MIRKDYSFGNKLLLFLIAMICALGAQSQGKKPMKSTFESFLDTQWWLGVRFGINYSDPNVSRRLSAFSPIDYEEGALSKSYNSFQNPGAHAGMDLSFYHKGFSLGLQPSYKRVNYSYSQALVWTGDTDQDRFETEYKIDQYLNFIEIPFTLQYEIYKKGKIRPYVLAGSHYSLLISAGKDTKVTHRDFSSTDPQGYSGGSFSKGVKNEFQNYFGLLGGVGAAFDYFNIRTVFGLTYMHALSSVSKQNTAYADDQLSSLGEANDRIKLNNINASISLVFPLRYIDKTFQPY